MTMTPWDCDAWVCGDLHQGWERHLPSLLGIWVIGKGGWTLDGGLGALRGAYLAFLVTADRQFIKVGSMRKVIVSDLSVISGAWVGYTCDRIHLRDLGLGILLHEPKKCTPQSIARQSGL